ncbi:MAG: Gmad2 immunoglobulin-like domain-containing protein [Chloroflexi bacterium]|nr:Gmad2 immunoglobulin-like domain-containing protein [Chloroflexota bacterium]
MKIGLFLGLALASIALLVACNNGGDSVTPGPDGAPTPAVTDSDNGTPTPEVTPAETATAAPEVCQLNPDPATPKFQVIDQPSTDDTVTSPVTISGQVLAFEATYQIGIFDAAGNPIVETFGTAGPGEAGELVPFSIDVAFNVDEETLACIWVYEASARDGSSIHVGQIPVTLSP